MSSERPFDEAQGKRAVSNETVIKVSNVSKTFKLPHEKHTSLKGLFLNSFRRKSYEIQKALSDVSFEVKKGEFFGIVGKNGSGKSTLLKCLAGVYLPSSGHIQINGSLVPFIELGVGFNPNLSGRDNVFLNGALLGFSRKQIEQMYDDIVEFAELEQFMDQKLKNYSSGMQVRLAFSIAIKAKGDILLLDEVLAVGDSAFQRKCINFFKDVKKSGKTVILVSHSMPTIEEFCDRALMLEDSKIVAIGSPMKVALDYQVANSPAAVKASKRNRPRVPHIKIKNVKVRSQKGLTNQFALSDDMLVDVELDVKKKDTIQLNMGIVTNEGDFIAGINSTDDIPKFTPSPGIYHAKCIVRAGQIPRGSYRLNVAIYSDGKQPEELIDVVSSDFGATSPIIAFSEVSSSKNGKFLINARWEIE